MMSFLAFSELSIPLTSFRGPWIQALQVCLGAGPTTYGGLLASGHTAAVSCRHPLRTATRCRPASSLGPEPQITAPCVLNPKSL